MTVMQALGADLEAFVAGLYDRHLATAKEWFPHELVPWARGRDFGPDAPWDPEQSPVPTAVRVALLVNLLTEDNLPYYYTSLSVEDRDSSWAQWTRQWTAEEGRHAIVIRDYLTVTRSIDPVALERGRMQQVAKGETPTFDTVEAGLVYTTLQELATRIAHRNTGELLDDPAGRAVMRRVAADENLHHLFYRDLATEMLTRDPSSMVVAMDEVVRTFAMPGTGIADFARHARTIATLGVYDFSIHYHQIVAPMVLQRWDVEALTGLDDDAEQARDRLVRFVERLAKAAARTDAKREAREAALAGSR
jgi:acyl-[acyl-carrier protein] desaturase